MAFKAYFDRPSYYQNKFDFYNAGSSPKLLEELISHINQNAPKIKEIYIALYLYNNAILDSFLKEISKTGIVVNVFTIPIEGYEASNSSPIKDIKTGSVLFNKTKYDLAKDIFSEHYTQNLTNFNLFFFPHIYLRSSVVKTFSRGNMPYSLHIKTFLFEYNDSSLDLMLSSSNFAVRDLVKEENLLVIENEPQYTNSSLTFFKNLIKASIKINDFDFKADYSSYEIRPINYALNPNCDYIAPFYYDSPFLMEDRLEGFLNEATERIIIVGQHVCPIDYSIDENFYTNKNNRKLYRSGLANILIEKAKCGVKINIMSQTFVSDDNTKEVNYRKPVNSKNFVNFYRKLKPFKNVNYFVNENCHSKFIIVDDKLFVSTFNYTPTQFIFLDKVTINNFTNNKDKKYKGVYSEVGSFAFLKNAEVVEAYASNFKELCADIKTKAVK